MSCDVAALPFQAHANYGTWSIDFGNHNEKTNDPQNFVKYIFFKDIYYLSLIPTIRKEGECTLIKQLGL